MTGKCLETDYLTHAPRLAKTLFEDTCTVEIVEDGDQDVCLEGEWKVA